MNFTISRDFLDGMLLQHPKATGETKEEQEIKINANIQFLPSSPDGTMHTAVTTMQISLGTSKEPFAQGGWRILFNSEEKWNPKEDNKNEFLKHLLTIGTSKIMATLNPLCMHANMPLLPIDTVGMVNKASQNPKE